MSKQPVPELGDPVRAALTDREWSVLREVAKGEGCASAGRALGIAEQTAKNHMQVIRLKLNVQSTISALRVVGWLRVP